MFVKGQKVNYVVCTWGWLHRWTENEHCNSWPTNLLIFNNYVQARWPLHERDIKNENRGGDQGLLQHNLFTIRVKCAPQVPEIVSCWKIDYPWPLMPTSTAVQHSPLMSSWQCCRPVCNIVKIWNWAKYKAAAYLVWVMVTWESCGWGDLIRAAIIIWYLSSLLSSRSSLLSSLLSSRSSLLSSRSSLLSSRSPSCLRISPRWSSLSLELTQSLKFHFPDYSVEQLESINYLIMASVEFMAAWAEFRLFMLLGVTRWEVSIRRRSWEWKLKSKFLSRFAIARSMISRPQHWIPHLVWAVQQPCFCFFRPTMCSNLSSQKCQTCVEQF